MLSRVAARIYWMSRYLERAENNARLMSVYGQLLLDLPAGAGLGWDVPLEILGLGAGWRDADPATRGDELHFVVAGPSNTASLLASLHLARENARTTRDVVPSEAWQAVNELHLFADHSLPAITHTHGTGAITEIVRRCHEITGILEGGLSHGPAYQFVRLGRFLERADMSSRMIDVAASIMMSGRDELQHHRSTIWRAVLRALSAYQMYRQHVRRRITGNDVLEFLLLNGAFPRAVLHCVDQLDAAAACLPRPEATQGELARLRERLQAFDLGAADYAVLHRFVDDLQLEFAALDQAIFETWLNPVRVA